MSPRFFEAKTESRRTRRTRKSKGKRKEGKQTTVGNPWRLLQLAIASSQVQCDDATSIRRLDLLACFFVFFVILRVLRAPLF